MSPDPNDIGQITLQGRKYGVGFLIIAQRTANVSKTVLTQCNTVICFQAFDETSFNFLGNYVGKDIVQVLPNLKQCQKQYLIIQDKKNRAPSPWKGEGWDEDWFLLKNKGNPHPNPLLFKEREKGAFRQRPVKLNLDFHT